MTTVEKPSGVDSSLKKSEPCIDFDKKVKPHNCTSFSSICQEIQLIYEDLPDDKKFYLSCIAMLSENQVVKRRPLINWWLAEGCLQTSSTGGKTPEKYDDKILESSREKGLIEPAEKPGKGCFLRTSSTGGKTPEKHGVKILDSSVEKDLTEPAEKQGKEGFLQTSRPEGKTPEEQVDEILEIFMEKGLIEPAEKQGKRRVKNYRMHLLVRSAVMKVSGNTFFSFDNGIPTSNISYPNRACIIKYGENKETNSWKNIEKIVTIFNVSEPFPDLNLQQLTKRKESIHGREWLSKMRNIRVLYLGKWLKSPAYHIEVESAAFLSGLKSMKELRLLSLRGISNINMLPDFIGRHKKLIIIDVKECHNLEALPKDVSLLKNLTYLDVSNCHILDRMPKGISSLTQLQVFKGFVITAEPRSSNSGALDDLRKLERLRKLSIIANSIDFPTAKDLKVLRLLGEQRLRDLAIAWELKECSHGTKEETRLELKQGSSHGTKEGTRTEEIQENTESALLLPENLVKLGLQGFPKPKMPHWLVAGELRHLKKLCVRGGMLKTLGNKFKWSVETLCLKFLNDLKTDWKELQDSFPYVVYLEKVKCPKVTFCPCDEDGVWVKPPTK